LIPQDLALLDSARAFEIPPRGLIENVSIHLPRERVERQLKARTVFTKLANNSASTQLIRALVHSLINTPGSPGGAPRSGDSEALQCALLALLPMALTEQPQVFDLEGHVAPNDLSSKPDGCKRHRRIAILWLAVKRHRTKARSRQPQEKRKRQRS
jgi:hypothetical protein